jgi:aspartyl-tRNA(Asn)/glutamyl-tRNA(Gln) amidotransferase subunit C
MSKITEAEVERVAKLARIGVTPAEAKSLAGELDAIVGFVEQLQSVDIEGIEPTDQVTGLENVMREDVVKPATQTRDELLANAPQSKDGYIVVKRVLNG